MNLDDLLGTPQKKLSIDDLLGPRKKSRRGSKMTYRPLDPPRGDVAAGGIWDLRRKKGKNLGKTCLIPGCGVELHSRGGRPPVICGKKSCFRSYRNAYRLDYDAERGS